LGITETLLSEYESAVDHLAEAADLHAGLGETSSAAKCRMNVLAAHAREGTVLSKLDAFGEVAEAILFARDELLLPLLGNLAARVALEQEEFEHASKVLGGLDAVWQESEATQPSAEIEFRDRTLRALSQCVAAQNLKSWLRKGKAEGLLSTLTQYVRQSQLSNGL
jgi:hypothetical protein